MQPPWKLVVEDLFARDIEHRRIPADTGRAAVSCCPHPTPADHATTWRFDPAPP